MPAFLFDLDGTLVDSVYEHVTAWHHAFASRGVDIPAFEYHKRIGMTGPAMIDAIVDAFALEFDDAQRQALADAHAAAYRPLRERATPIPGVHDLWRALAQRNVPWAIATSAKPDDTKALLGLIGAPPDAIVVTQESGTASKPSPDIFDAAAQRLGVELRGSFIVGDAVWDMLAARRCGAFGIGVLTGGYGEDELSAAGAYRVYRTAGEMSRRLNELGVSP